MAKFKVGDTVVRVRHDHLGMVTGDISVVISFNRRKNHVTLVGYAGLHYVNSLRLAKPANPNHITVSSLDYMTSTTLTDEDKETIKEYLYENS